MEYTTVEALCEGVAGAIREKEGSTALINPQDFVDRIKGLEVGGEGGGATINNQDKVVDITENGTTEVVADGGFTGLGKVTINTEVEGAKPKWTGHADAEGLKAIGWTDEDIAYYQENGVNWNEEDDEYHKVTDDNKALYGVLTADNISSYKERIVYLPKIDTSGKTSLLNIFRFCYRLIATPSLDTSNATSLIQAFSNCFSLTCVGKLDTSKVTSMKAAFEKCYSLLCLPAMDTSKVTSMSRMCYECNSLRRFGGVDTSSVTEMAEMFYSCEALTDIQLNSSNLLTRTDSLIALCYSLTSITGLDVTNSEYFGDEFDSNYSLTNMKVKGVKKSFKINLSALLSKESLLYIINNEAATSAITITLASYAYDKWATDADVVAALANHPNISLAK